MASDPKPHGKKWRIEWRHEGALIKKGFDCETDAALAKRFVENRGHAVAANDPAWISGKFRDITNADEVVEAVAAKVARSRTFGAVAEQMIHTKAEVEKSIAENSAANYRRALRFGLEDWVPRDITTIKRADLEAKRNDLRTRRNERGDVLYTEHSVSNKISVALATLYFAFRHGIIATNPCVGFDHVRNPGRERKPNRFIERDHYAILRDAAFDDQVKLMLMTLAETGMRIAELLALPVHNIVVDQGDPYVYAEWQWREVDGKPRTIERPKKYSIRKIGITHALASMLAAGTTAYTTDEKLPDGKPAVFAFPTPYTRRAWQYHNFMADRWNPTVKKAHANGFPASMRPTPHDLRHSHGSWLLNDGRSMMAVSKRLGHKSIQTTVDVYGEVSIDEHRNILHSLRGLV